VSSFRPTIISISGLFVVAQSQNSTVKEQHGTFFTWRLALDYCYKAERRHLFTHYICDWGVLNFPDEDDVIWDTAHLRQIRSHVTNFDSASHDLLLSAQRGE
jgi:hypothetical protein